jgi:hypothetical protein
MGLALRSKNQKKTPNQTTAQGVKSTQGLCRICNKFLSWFGLMKISRARNIGIEIHRTYVLAVLDGVNRDFGALNKPSALAAKLLG